MISKRARREGLLEIGETDLVQIRGWKRVRLVGAVGVRRHSLFRSAKAEKEAEKEKSGDSAAKTQFLFINADSSDKELTEQLLKVFEDKRDWIAAGPLFEGSAEEITKDLDANLVDCDTLLLVYGKADAPWVRAQLRRYSKIERLRDTPLQVKTILFAPPAPKPEIAMSGGFARIDCQSGLSGDRVDQIVAELRR
jgi:hypothetical protein